MKVKCVLISVEEYQAQESARRAAFVAESAKIEEAEPGITYEELWKRPEIQPLSRKEWFAAGTMYYCPWIWDPLGEDAGKECIARPKGYLSVHYVRDWSTKRPPIVVICPDGTEWCVDAGSSNGDGWKVTGEAPLITCSPSILVPGYHGFLRGGEFSEPL